MVACPALFIGAPASGQGKTTVTAALARWHVRQGRRVLAFKCGPDFLDTQVLAAATGATVYNLDLDMCGHADAARRLHAAAMEADLILVEGVMGLFDGHPPAAQLARDFKLPIVAVIDGSKMAGTFGAVAQGLATYWPDLHFAGVLANRVASASHAALLRESVRQPLRWLGHVPRDAGAALPERHLGLVQASEIADLECRLDRIADALGNTELAALPPTVTFLPSSADAPALRARARRDDEELAALPPVVAFLPSPSDALAPSAPARRADEAWAPLRGKTIAVARDAAFAFIYPANLECLAALGARVVFFSPLAATAMPPCDALWLPGGYPELHAAHLSANQTLWADVHAHHAQERPIFAECGGMMVLFDTLETQAGTFPMAGLLAGRVVMQTRLAALGMQALTLAAGELRGHAFHYSRAETALAPAWHGRKRDGTAGEPVYRRGSLTASYLHLYFPSCPRAAAALFGAALPPA